MIPKDVVEVSAKMLLVSRENLTEAIVKDVLEQMVRLGFAGGMDSYHKNKTDLDLQGRFNKFYSTIEFPPR